MSQDIKKIFSKNLNRMMESRGETLSDLSASIDVAFSTVSDWKNAKKMPRSAALQKIAEHYNVNISDLTSDFENSQNFKASEAYIPLMGIVTAGQPLEMYDNPEEIQVPVDIANAYPNSYLLQVDGDSMNKLVPDGSYVLIQKTKELDSGEVGVVAVNGTEATLKRFFKAGNNIVLQPESYNPIHSNQFYDCSKGECNEIRIIGKLVWHMAPLNYKY
ncbi:helix-turn-helix domain-containing protein [Carnobacterium maltaromaticum]|uniref:helix-turn-helix domain-containing protein n=1 Tax=Carnobacterium maltaromaticum TaxID=2751 RepID=UPI0039B0D282